MDTRELVRQLILDYFSKRRFGSARDIHFRLGRNNFQYSLICSILDDLRQEGILDISIVKATKFIRAHYVYHKTEHKKEPLIQRLCNFMKKIIA